MPQEFEDQYKNLNSKQKEAVSTIEGPVMVIAGPGTGKTTILTLRIANILKETDAQPENILALTFTESAVFSMRQKLNKLIGPLAYRVNIFTFHGFCNHLIEQYPEYYDKIISSRPITESEQLNLIEKIIKNGDFNLIRPIGDPTYYVTKIKSAISHLKKEGFTSEEYEEIIKNEIKEIEGDSESFNKKTGKLKTKLASRLRKLKRSLELVKVYKTYKEESIKNKLYDFDDMILETLEAFEKDPDFLLEQQEKYQYLLADEHQDTNHAQNKILELLSDFHEYPNIFIVGDEKQAIFRFQGASLENFLYFKDKFKNTKIIQLKDNYRSTQSILDNAYKLISNNETDDVLKVELKSYQKETEPIIINEYKTQDEENWGIGLEIEDLIKKGVDPNKIAIIYRQNSDILGISKILQRRNIPFFIKSKQNILESDDYLRVKILLNAVINPSKKEFIIPFLHLDFLDIDIIDAIEITNKIKNGVGVFEIVNSSKEKFNNLESLNKNLNLLKKISKDSSNVHSLEIFEKIIADFGLLQNIISSDNSIERISVINKIYEELKKNSLKKRNYLISDFVDHLNTLENYNIDLESYISGLEEGVSLMTAHGSKGLEFEYVFVIYVSQKRWGSSGSNSYFELPYINLKIQNNQSVEDERRLFYVAITRAKKKVYISYSQFDSDSKEGSPSQFISELDENLIKITKTKTKDFEKVFADKFKDSTKSENNFKNKKYLNKIFIERPMSVTALNNYLECPWRYFYSNLIRVPMVITESLALGNSVHACFNWYVNNIQKDPTFDELKEVLKDKVEKQLISTDMKENIIKESEKFLEGYYNNFLKKLNKKGDYLTEYSINNVFIDVDGGQQLRLKGNLDRIDFESYNKVKIIDYKTSKPKSINEILGKTQNSDGNYYRQLVFYKLLIDNHKDWTMQEAELSFVKPDDKGNYVSRKFEISKEETKELENQIKKVSKEILNLDFWYKKCEKKDCEYCKMRDIFN